MFGRQRGISKQDRERKIWQVRVIGTEVSLRDVILADRLSLVQARSTAHSVANSRNVISAFVERMPGK